MTSACDVSAWRQRDVTGSDFREHDGIIMWRQRDGSHTGANRKDVSYFDVDVDAMTSARDVSQCDGRCVMMSWRQVMASLMKSTVDRSKRPAPIHTACPADYIRWPGMLFSVSHHKIHGILLTVSHIILQNLRLMVTSSSILLVRKSNGNIMHIIRLMNNCIGSRTD